MGCEQSTNLQNARDNLKRNAEDLELIKDFSTTTEVPNMPWTSQPPCCRHRVHNQSMHCCSCCLSGEHRPGVQLQRFAQAEPEERRS